jgi:transcriptional regulator with XRE-family HTH domain
MAKVWCAPAWVVNKIVDIEIYYLQTLRYGAAMRALRVVAGMSQTELADALGVPVVTVSAWEIGRWAPLPNDLAALAIVLEVPGERFFRARGLGRVGLVFWQRRSDAVCPKKLVLRPIAP